MLRRFAVAWKWLFGGKQMQSNNPRALDPAFQGKARDSIRLRLRKLERGYRGTRWQ